MPYVIKVQEYISILQWGVLKNDFVLEDFLKVLLDCFDFVTTECNLTIVRLGGCKKYPRI